MNIARQSIIAFALALLLGAASSLGEGINLDAIRKGLPETITAVTERELETKIPRSYSFDYTGLPQPGKRIWQRIDATTWHEVYPDGHTSVFKVLGRATVKETEGTIVVKVAGALDKTETPNDGGLQAFIPDKGSKVMHHWYRNSARGDTEWNDLAEMNDVK